MMSVGGLVLVHGGPGCGKTELAAHVRAWATEHELTVLAGQWAVSVCGLVCGCFFFLVFIQRRKTGVKLNMVFVGFTSHVEF